MSYWSLAKYIRPPRARFGALGRTSHSLCQTGALPLLRPLLRWRQADAWCCYFSKTARAQLLTGWLRAAATLREGLPLVLY